MAVTELTPQEKAVEMFNQGSTPKEVSDTLGIPAETARTWKSRHFKQSDSDAELQNLKRDNETQLQNLKRTETAFQNLESEFQDLKRNNETQLQDLKRCETAFQNLKRKSETDETAFQNLKRKNAETETAFQNLKRTETELANEAKLLRGQIDNLTAQLKSHTTTGNRELGNQERLLNGQISILTGQLDKANNALAAIDKAWTNRVESKENAHEAALQTLNLKLVEATEAYQNKIAKNDENWFESLKEAEQKNADLVAAHTAELAPHLQSQAEREATVTVLELINYGEIAVAVVGACIMFQWVGAVIAFPAVLFYYDAMRTVKKASSWDSAQFAIFVCGVLSFAFGFIHYNTALRYNDSDAYPKWIVAIVAAMILSGISVAALWQNYLKKNENA